MAMTDNGRQDNLEVETHVESSLSLTDPSPKLKYDLRSCGLRFLSSAFFGLFLDILILFVFGIAVLAGCRPGVMGLLYTLIEVPVIMGILGIFFFSEMLDLAEEIATKFHELLKKFRQLLE